MKIAIYHDSTLPKRGGGFVLKQELLQGLGKLILPNNIKFVFFSWEDSQSLRDVARNHSSYVYCENKRFKLLSVLRGFMRRLSFRTLISDLFMLLAGKHKQVYESCLNCIQIKQVRYTRFETQLKQQNVDFILFLEPWEIFTTGSLYVCLNWDLAHFEDPYFPEFIQGDWESVSGSKIAGLQKAMRVINGTEVLCEQVHRHANIAKERMHVLPFPTPSDCIEYAKRTTRQKGIGLSQKLVRPFLFYPASFWPHKNHTLLLHALKVLKNTEHERDLVFCGANKGNKEYIQRITEELGLKEQVHFFDFLKRESVLELYANADALVFPSFIGPDNIPPLEAFALRCPVIASRLSGSTEQLGEAAYLFNPQSVSSLVEAIKSLLADKDGWSIRVNKGISRACSWTASEYAIKLCDIFRELEPYIECCEPYTYNVRFS